MHTAVENLRNLVKETAGILRDSTIPKDVDHLLDHCYFKTAVQFFGNYLKIQYYEGRLTEEKFAYLVRKYGFSENRYFQIGTD